VTDESSPFDWKSVLSERGHDPEPVEAPTGRDEGAADLAWFQLITRFTQRGFLRVIAANSDDKVKVELQVALPGGDDAGYLDALLAHLRDTGISLELVSEERPWTLDLEVDAEEELRELVDDLELLSEHVRLAENSTALSALVEAWSDVAPVEDAQRGAADEEETNGDTPDASSGGGPFESIGDDEPAEDAQPPTESEGEEPKADSPKTGIVRARLAAFRIRVESPAIVLTAKADIDADDSQLEQLGRSLRSKLENRFDLVARSTDVDSDANQVALTLEPSELGATYGMPLGDLADDLARYLDRQRDLADLGVSLDKLSPPSRRERDEKPRRSRSERAEKRSRGQEPKAEVEEEESGVVFGFGEEEIQAASPSDSNLEPGDYTDPRVMREDATTALVDVVLRHPGYSDRNMRQVLSILLDVDYYRAGKLIDEAPCVIAWGVSQERAREFKRVIEGAGGRVTLVEPDTLAEAE
jgi:ribosomal protein L7/L12